MLVDFVSGSRIFLNDGGIFYSVPRLEFHVLFNRDKLDNVNTLRGYRRDTNNICCDGQDGSVGRDTFVVDRNVERHEALMYNFKKLARAYTTYVNSRRHLYFWCFDKLYDIFVFDKSLHIGNKYSILFDKEPEIYFKYICRGKEDTIFYLSLIAEVDGMRFYYLIEFTKNGAEIINTTDCNTDVLYQSPKHIDGNEMSLSNFMKASLLGSSLLLE